MYNDNSTNIINHSNDKNISKQRSQLLQQRRQQQQYHPTYGHQRPRQQRPMSNPKKRLLFRQYILHLKYHKRVRFLASQPTVYYPHLHHADHFPLMRKIIQQAALHSNRLAPQSILYSYNSSLFPQLKGSTAPAQLSPCRGKMMVRSGLKTAPVLRLF